MRSITACFIIVSAAFFSCKGGKSNYTEPEPGIYLTGRNQPINSLNELNGLFKGKPVFIDRWATWCDPCLNEFRYKDSLLRYLNNRNINMLYLNSDKEIQADSLEIFIRMHDLKGYHLMMNDSLKADLVKNGVFIPGIPQYILIDGMGKVLSNKMLRPSDGDKLYSQIDSLLNITVSNEK